MAASPSQVAKEDPDFELFGEPKNPNSIEKSVGGIDSSEVCTISYEIGEIVREAMIPVATINSALGRQALEELRKIETLTDVILDARNSGESLSMSWVDWLHSLRRVTGLTLIGFRDVCSLERTASKFQSLIRLNIGFSEFSVESLRVFSTVPTVNFLYLAGVITDSSFPPKPFCAPNVLSLILNLRGSTLEHMFLANTYPGLRSLSIHPSLGNLKLLQSELPLCKVSLEEAI